MPLIALFDWSLYTLPTSIPTADIEGDTHSNHPDSVDYNPSAPTWIGETFTFNGGSSTQIEIIDDDDQFEDAYVETGGAQTLAQDVTINGVTYPAGSTVQNEFSMLDASGNEIFVIAIGHVNVGFGYPVGQEPTAGETFVGVEGRDGDPFDSSDGVSGSSEPYTAVACFSEGTLISTPEGERPVEQLKPADLVVTLDHGAQAIRWIHKSTHALKEASSDARPVLIGAGALGRNLPACDLIVSPQHRMLVGGGGQLQRYFASEVLVPAKSLTVVPGVRIMKGKTRITWVHFACDRHEVVTANGCLSESLLLGPMVVNGMQAAERREVTRIFSHAQAHGRAMNGPPARVCHGMRAVRRQLEKVFSENRHIVARNAGGLEAAPAAAQPVAGAMHDATPEYATGETARGAVGLL